MLSLSLVRTFPRSEVDSRCARTFVLRRTWTSQLASLVLVLAELGVFALEIFSRVLRRTREGLLAALELLLAPLGAAE